MTSSPTKDYLSLSTKSDWFTKHPMLHTTSLCWVFLAFPTSSLVVLHILYPKWQTTNKMAYYLSQHHTNKDAHTVHCIFYSLTVFYAYPVRKICFLILKISFFEIYSSTAYFTEEAECEIFNVHIKICFRQIHSNTLVSIVV